MIIDSRIVLNNLELRVNLGWPEQERAQQQIVILNATICFATPPNACLTDQLTDTHCYDALIDAIKTKTTQRGFRLLEHLAHEIYQLIKQLVALPAKVHVTITKKPSILNLTGGVTFCYGDL